MKKYRIRFSLANLVQPSQQEVVTLQNRIKGFTGVGTFGTWLGSNADYALIVAAIGFFLDTITSCLYFEKLEE